MLSSTRSIRSPHKIPTPTQTTQKPQNGPLEYGTKNATRRHRAVGHLVCCFAVDHAQVALEADPKHHYIRHDEESRWVHVTYRLQVRYSVIHRPQIHTYELSTRYLNRPYNVLRYHRPLQHGLRTPLSARGYTICCKTKILATFNNFVNAQNATIFTPQKNESFNIGPLG